MGFQPFFGHFSHFQGHKMDNLFITFLLLHTVDPVPIIRPGQKILGLEKIFFSQITIV